MIQTTWSRIRRSALWLLFAAVLVIPKTLGLRRRPRLWNSLRLLAAVAGVLVAAAGLTGHGGVLYAAAGAVLAILALAIAPERPRASIDARARELGALVVVEGGLYRAADGSSLDTLLFQGPELLWVMDKALRPLLNVPISQLRQLRVESADDGWKLLLVWDGGEAEFLYRGPFAEHFARVAESTVRSQVPNPLPILR